MASRLASVRRAMMAPAVRLARCAASLSASATVAAHVRGAQWELSQLHPPPPSARIARCWVAQQTDGALVVQWGGTPTRLSKFHHVWLYHNSAAHKDASSGQVTLSPHLLGRAPSLTAAQLAPGGESVQLTYSDGTQHTFSPAWLRAHDYSDATLAALAQAAQPSPLLAAAAGKGSVPAFRYDQVLQSDEKLCKMLLAVNHTGIALVTGAPLDAGAAVRVASRIAPPMHTIYGTQWDVVASERPINIAYSTAGLDLHCDLVYYESPPGLQLLACRAFDASVVGGETTFLDGFAAAATFRDAHPGAFLTLCRVPATFQKVHTERQHPVHMVCRRPHIAVDTSWDAALRPAVVGSRHGDHECSRDGAAARLAASSGQQTSRSGASVSAAWEAAVLRAPITGLFWAPAFEGPLQVPSGDVGDYYDAYVKFASHLRSLETTPGKGLLAMRLAEGDIVVFNNRRMLHGRNPFRLPAAGSSEVGASEMRPPGRLLTGCYVNIDDFASRLQTLQKQRHDATPLRRVGNQQML